MGGLYQFSPCAEPESILCFFFLSSSPAKLYSPKMEFSFSRGAAAWHNVFVLRIRPLPLCAGLWLYVCVSLCLRHRTWLSGFRLTDMNLQQGWQALRRPWWAYDYAFLLSGWWVMWPNPTPHTDTELTSSSYRTCFDDPTQSHDCKRVQQTKLTESYDCLNIENVIKT